MHLIIGARLVIARAKRAGASLKKSLSLRGWRRQSRGNLTDGERKGTLPVLWVRPLNQ